jgi:hypothetical protein
MWVPVPICPVCRLTRSLPTFLCVCRRETLVHMSHPPDFSAAWQDYRRRRLWFLVIWLGGFAAVVILIYSLATVIPSDLLFYLIGGSWGMGFLVASLRLSYFRCPRCHKWFFLRPFIIHNPFAQRCVHCRLPKWQLNP